MIERFLKQTSFVSQDDYKKNLQFIVPERFNFAYDVMDVWAEEKPDKVALIWTNDEGACRKFTFADLKEQSDRTAAYFMVNMPGMDGIEVCRRIRDMVSCPIIFLTAKVEEQDRVMGLLSGGDDYVLKPFSLKELDARIIAHLKREERLHRKKEQRFYGELVIDYASKCVHIKGNALELTKLEYEIIEFLSMNPEMVFDKERIYEKIGGYDAEGDSRVVTELIRRIRKKMKMYSEHEYIATVWGRGYKWAK